MTQTALSFGRDDMGNKARVLALLQDGAWHSTLALQRVGGTRAPARVHELRSEGYVIECEGDAGRFRYRLAGREEPKARPLSWKRRALAAEAELASLRKVFEDG